MSLVEFETTTIREIVEAAVTDLDPKLAEAFRTALIGTYRLGGAIMRRQMLEKLAEGHQQLQLEVCDIALEGLAEH